MLPSLARRLHETPAAFEASVAQRYPAVSKGLAAWPSIKPGAVELVRRQGASVPDGDKMNGLDFSALPRYIIGPASRCSCQPASGSRGAVSVRQSGCSSSPS
jgi:hypothetical protein